MFVDRAKAWASNHHTYYSGTLFCPESRVMLCGLLCITMELPKKGGVLVSPLGSIIRRHAEDDSLGLVKNRIIGHVLFSKLKAPMKALGLAPVAAHPSFQKQGVGLALIREGLDQAKEDGWMCVFVIGDPAYYRRLGFRVEAAKGYSSPYSGGNFMAVPFGDVPKIDEIVYPKPFKLLD